MRRSNRIIVSFAGLVLAAGGLGGCAAQPQQVIPPTAQLQSSGNGQKLYRAPSEGTVYVYDKPGDRLIWSGQVKGGQVVAVEPERSEVTLNGSPVSNKMQVGNGRIDLFFEPSPMATAQPAGASVERTRTVTGSAEGTTVTSPGSFTVQPPPVTVTPSVKVEQQPIPADAATPAPATPAPVPAGDPGK